LYGGAVIMLGINDGRSMSEPVNFDDIRSIDYAHVYDRYQALSTDSIFDTDLLSPNYGNPLLYNITDPATGAMYTVHHDRVIRVDGVINVPRRKRANNGWGESIMTACYNYIRDYCSSLGNIATLFNDMVKTVLKMQNFVSLVGSDLESVHARVSNISISSANNNVMVIDANEELERHALSLSGYPEMFDRLALGLAAVVQVPAGMLFGIEPAGLNASGEYSTKNMYDSIAGYQQSKLAPAIKKFASLVMMGRDYNFGAIPDNWSVEFVPLQQMTELESAEVRLKMAESDKIYIESGVLTPEEVAMSRFGGEAYSIDTTIDKALHNDPRFMHEVEAENAEAMTETVGPDEK
jgi:phage-related protein (TIGR01555 family)